ncbi:MULTISPECIES: uroporphyrinogen-III C-methyltransferase [Pseudomonas]|uniref:Uroporphyrinogen-III C-methyltransferase n=1 Tax=Pseudomonas syringae pv. papulans TaxID=83963 RepID=A0AA43IXL7_PSESX|nr:MULTISPECIES: uroporphyrinogen-III C-methyltransferase [Pseudomonas]MBC8879527.1 uroporphyrinogen-III C-methyltransferase [Pseudomonas cerasi]ELQ11941.1 uroporphyrin-III C-methyltransferase [Pseudomonas syringae BRIP39023]KPB24726.1 Uroporphyrin-III C-methyltransferase [Pseudomonas syringae pv. syringae]MBI6559685.1 uroporphyrinogen-III C-methyltransferase [Pseudomonas syringae]MBI6572414.1 uroporphyrinogen-III C-methyltransferase [Pseudomonas syringae]
MSETALPKDEESVLKTPASKPEPVRTERTGSRNSGLVFLALLLAIAGIAVAGWGVWQLRMLQAGHQQQRGQVEDIAEQTLVLAQNDQQLSARIAQFPPANQLEDSRRLVAQLQGDQQRLSQRLETVLGASRKDWRLAEAEHLLRLASLRLSALQDINSAQALVQGADEILREQDDPGSFAAREQLAKSLAALRSIEQPDRTGLFLQLAALREQAVQLNKLAPEYEDKGESLLGLTADKTESSRWTQWWDEISHYFRIDFNADKDIRPVLAGQSLSQVRLALSLALEQAQWAALNGEPEVYSKAITEAQNVLKANFDQDDPQGKALGQGLDAVASQPVSVKTPDLAPTLSAVQAYLERRHAAGQPAEAQQGTSR